MRLLLAALSLLALTLAAPAQGPARPTLHLTNDGKTFTAPTHCACATGGVCTCGPNCTCTQPVAFLDPEKGGSTASAVKVKPGEVPTGFTEPAPGSTGTHLLYPDGTLVPIAAGHVAGKADPAAAAQECADYAKSFAVQLGSSRTGSACGINGCSATVINGQTVRFGPSIYQAGACGAGGCSSCGQSGAFGRRR